MFIRASAFAERDRLPLHRLHLATEQAICESGIPYTILRHAYYTELLAALRLLEAVESGRLTSPPGNGSFTLASRIDLAQAAAAVLTEAGHTSQTYELTAPHAWNLHDLAAVLSPMAGKRIVYESDEADANGVYGLLVHSDMRSVSPMLAQLAKRPLRSLADEVEAVLGNTQR